MPIKEDVPYITKYLTYAFEFEKYKEIWQESLDKAENKLMAINNRKNELSGNYQYLSSRIENFDLSTQNEYSNKIKSIRKFKIFSIICFCIVPLIALYMVAIMLWGNSYGYGNEITLSQTIFGAIFIAFSMGFLPFTGGITFLLIYRYKKGKISKKQFMYNAQQQKQALVTDKDNAKQEYGSLVTAEKNISTQKAEIVKELKEVKKILKELYQSEQWPESYQGLIPVGTMLESLQTGRCTTIQGHGGMIDTYVKDLQQKLILGTLNDIKQIALQSLSVQEKMLQYQHLLLNEVRSINKTVDKIEADMQELIEISDEIRKNTEISAIADQQTAQHTEYLAYKAWMG